MKKPILFLLVLFVSTTNSFAQISSALQARLQFVLDSVCAHYNIKGASAAVLIPQQGTWTGAYGESDAGQPITTNMFFGIGSNTKTYTSTLILKLEEDGLLDLDDTIGTWIQNVTNVDGQVTVRQLLNHTSGLYNFTDNPAFTAAINNDVTAVWQPEQVLQFINAPSFVPGTNWGYSNTNYLLAGLIIKSILGVPYYTALRDSVLQPNGLVNTVNFPFEQPSFAIPNYWSVHFGAPYLVSGSYIGYDQTAMASMANAAGAIFATAEDNVQFWSRLTSGAIINANSLQEMRQCIALSPTLGYGLGIFRRASFNGHVAFTHGGTNVGFINENMADSVTGTCISVLTNQDSISNTIVLTKVVAALHRESMGPLSVNNAISNTINATVYPNPAQGYANIICDSDEELTMHLFDITGKEIMNKKMKSTLSLSLEDMSSGLYYIHLANKNNEVLFKSKLSVH